MSLVTSSPTNQGRTTKPRPARQSGSLSGRAQTSRRRLAMTPAGGGEAGLAENGLPLMAGVLAHD